MSGAELATTPLNPSAKRTSALARRVAADLAAAGWRLERVLSDNGREFRSAEFGATIQALGARQTFIRAGRPATNGAVERAQRTISKHAGARPLPAVSCRKIGVRPDGPVCGPIATSTRRSVAPSWNVSVACGGGAWRKPACGGQAARGAEPRPEAAS